MRQRPEGAAHFVEHAARQSMLVEEGRMRWDDAVFDPGGVHPQATLEQLLTHHAGMPAMTAFFRRGRPRARAAFCAPSPERSGGMWRHGSCAAAHPPGDRFAYSNGGYVVAASPVEDRLATPYETMMQQRLFTPLGMRHAGFGWPATTAHPSAPLGHSLVDGKWLPRPPREWPRMPQVFAAAADVHPRREELSGIAPSQCPPQTDPLAAAFTTP